MATVTLQGTPVETLGELPAAGSKAPDFTLVTTELGDATCAEYLGKRIVLNIFPSIDTGVCAASVRAFNKEASNLDNTVVLCISADLPFAHQRFCEGEGLNNVIPLSSFRSADFGKTYGVAFSTGPLVGLLSRAIVVINPKGGVVYTEQVGEITKEPNYDAAIKAVQGA